MLKKTAGTTLNVAYQRFTSLVKRRPVLLEIAVVSAALVLLQWVLFSSYYSGRSIPPWDFLGSYNTEPYAWWEDGSFWNPTQWMDYLWGGYPAAANLQNSSWYLPVGIAHSLSPYTLWMASIVAALHVALGALGVYLLLRAWSVRPSAAFLGLLAWHFAPGFFANASHIDIARGYAWLPWLLLLASHRFPWNKWWSPILAAFVFWQAIQGVYPGMVIVFVGTVLVFVVIQQIAFKPKITSFVLPLAISVVAAFMISLVRLLPAFSVRGAGGAGNGDTSQWSANQIGALLFDYGNAALPGDITMRSYFVGASIIGLLAFAKIRDRNFAPFLGLGICAWIIGAPDSPWKPLTESLPGMSISRFVLSDVKPVMLITLVVLACFTLNHLLDYRSRSAEQSSAGTATKFVTPMRFAVAVSFIVVFASVGSKHAPEGTSSVPGQSGLFQRPEAIAQVTMLAMVVILVWFTATAVTKTQVRVAVLGLLAVTLGSGLIYVHGNQSPWITNRVDTEIANYGDTISASIASRIDRPATKQRPARHEPLLDAFYEDPPTTTPYNVRGGRSLYTRELGFTGYINLRGAETFDTIRESIMDEALRDDAWAFWLAPGIAISVTPGDAVPSQVDTEKCVASGDCGLVQTEAIYYDKSPLLKYSLEVASPSDVWLNEAYYNGWQGQACQGGSQCHDLEIKRGPGGQVTLVGLPAGHWDIELKYETPGLRLSQKIMYGTFVGLIIWATTLGLVDRRKSSVSRADTTNSYN